MASKHRRGGLAGIWDRNKHIITPAAEVLAGMFGTPALSALIGAAVGGLDNEGKKGISLNMGGAARGGLYGYGAGKAGQWAGRRAGQWAGTKAAALPGPELDSVANASAAQSPKKTFLENLQKSLPQAPAALPSGATAPKPAWKKAADWSAAHPEVVAGAGNAAATMMESGAERNADAARLQFDRERWEAEQEERRKRGLVAENLYQMLMGQMSWNKPRMTA